MPMDRHKNERDDISQGATNVFVRDTIPGNEGADDDDNRGHHHHKNDEDNDHHNHHQKYCRPIVHIKDLMTPCFIMNRYAMERNCSHMLELIKHHQIHLRPHIKTHKTIPGCYIQATGHYHPENYGVHDDNARRVVHNQYDDVVTGFVASTLPEISMIVQHVATLHGNHHHHRVDDDNDNDNNKSSHHGKHHEDDDDDGHHERKPMKTNTNNKEYRLAPPAFYDILYGVPISEYKLSFIETLRQQYDQYHGIIHILVDHMLQIDFIEQFMIRMKKEKNKGSDEDRIIRPYSVFIKLDTGYHRAGITCDERGIALAMKIIKSPYLTLKGVYTHCGHAYDENDPAKLCDIVQADYHAIQQFLSLLEVALQQHGGDSSTTTSSSSSSFDINDLVISIGSTPSAKHHPSSLISSTKRNTIELHPGNYVFYDRQQLWTNAIITTTTHDDLDIKTTDHINDQYHRDSNLESYISGRVLSRVIGHYEDRNTILLDAGSLALSKDRAPQGDVCSIAGYPNVICTKLSQEVCTVTMKDPTMAFPYQDFPLGKLVTLLPNHSCLAAACYDTYYIIHDETCLFSPQEEIIDEWKPVKYFSI